MFCKHSVAFELILVNLLENFYERIFMKKNIILKSFDSLYQMRYNSGIYKVQKE